MEQSDTVHSYKTCHQDDAKKEDVHNIENFSRLIHVKSIIDSIDANGDKGNDYVKDAGKKTTRGSAERTVYIFVDKGIFCNKCNLSYSYINTVGKNT